MAPRTLANYMDDVRAYFPTMEEGELAILVWKGIQLICDEEELPFMVGEGKIVTAPSYSTGTITITGGVNVVLTGGAWPIGAGYKILIGGQAERYGITTLTGTTGTLDAAFVGTDTTDLTFHLFKDTYPVPADCSFAKEMVVWDVARNEELEFLDFESFINERQQWRSGKPGIPLCVTRGPIAADGTPQLIFDPPPSTARVYLVPYYKSPVKPASVDAALSPVWPSAFHDVIPLRALAHYTDRKGHPRRLEFAQRFRQRMARMRSTFDGGNELRRALKRKATGFRYRVNLAE